MRVEFTVKCPYCAHETVEAESISYVGSSHFDPEIAICDTDKGGCGRHFALRKRAFVTADLESRSYQIGED